MQVSDDDRVLVAAGLVRAARLDSSIFVDLIFGYESASFQQEWHRIWNRPGAHVVQWSPVEHGKTQQATGWALHLLGRDPENTRILWVGPSQSVARKSTNIIKTLIEEPPKTLSAVFPRLRPQYGTGEKWTETMFRVAGCRATEKDASVEVAGIETSILGGRFTDIILDDICTMNTTYTAEARAKVTKWVESTVLGRLLAGGRIICLGNAWYSDDVMHALKAKGFTVIHNKAYREDDSGRIIPESVLWPAQFPAWRLGELPDSLLPDGSPTKRRDFGTIESLRQLRCQPYNAGQSQFDLRWFDRAMQAGEGLTLVDEYKGEWGPAYLGVDVGITEKEGRDFWGFFAIAVDPATGRRRLLNGVQARMTGPTGIGQLKAWWIAFAPVIMVENNAAQEFIRQFAGEEGIPTRPFTTGKNKANVPFGVPSLGVELEQGMWILPSGDERSRALAIQWRTQCLAYTPGQHTGDLLMASWFAREAARGGGGPEGVVGKPKGAPSLAGYGQTRARYGGAQLGLFRR